MISTANNERAPFKASSARKARGYKRELHPDDKKAQLERNKGGQDVTMTTQQGCETTKCDWSVNLQLNGNNNREPGACIITLLIGGN